MAFLAFPVQAFCRNRLDQWAIGIFSFVPRPPEAAKSPGLLISRSYGRVMPARFA